MPELIQSLAAIGPVISIGSVSAGVWNSRPSPIVSYASAAGFAGLAVVSAEPCGSR